MAGQSVLARLQDIQAAIDGARQALFGVNLEAFAASWTLKHAVQRALEIISEASRHLPDELKGRYATTDWRAIAAIGNHLRHGYQRVDDKIVFDVVQHDLARLAEIVRAEILHLTENP
jgi:uncharacterized protein with HEPN domain